MSIEKFMRGAVTGWMASHGEHSDIVMSTRIRLSPQFDEVTNSRSRLTKKQAMEVDRAVAGALLDSGENGYAYMKMADLPALERQVLVEKHLNQSAIDGSKSAWGSHFVGR